MLMHRHASYGAGRLICSGAFLRINISFAYYSAVVSTPANQGANSGVCHASISWYAMYLQLKSTKDDKVVHIGLGILGHQNE